MSQNKLSTYQQKKIIFCFSNELTATQTTRLLHINRNTVNRYYRMLRENIAVYEEHQMRSFAGEVELDESYFGGYHKGYIGRTVKNKIPVFGILKRNGKVYTQIVPDVSART